MTSLPILTYHRLLPDAPTKSADPKRISVSRDQFRQHLLWLKRLGYRTLALPDYLRILRQGGKIPVRSFAITFDDGYQEVFPLACRSCKNSGLPPPSLPFPDNWEGQCVG